jgi:hypothetical protein
MKTDGATNLNMLSRAQASIRHHQLKPPEIYATLFDGDFAARPIGECAWRELTFT